MIKPEGVCLQKRSHLVDKRAGAACADSVHSLLETAAEVYDFGVLSAELYRYVCLRRELFKGGRNCRHLLHKWYAERFAYIYRARACNL